MKSENAIRRRIAILDAWLRGQGVDVKKEKAHLSQDSRERLYWHYGYLMGLKDAVDALVKSQSLPLH
jgi:hypothetical protein